LAISTIGKSLNIKTVGSITGIGFITLFFGQTLSLKKAFAKEEGHDIKFSAEVLDQIQLVASKLGLQGGEVLSQYFSHLKQKSETDQIDVSSYIDHTLLKPTATKEEVQKLCEEAKTHHFAAVCVNGSRADQAIEFFQNNNHSSKVAVVVGFPLGSMTSEAKAFETLDLVSRGADEIDMVINMGRLKDKDFNYVLQDIRGVVQSANGNVVKVILECGALTKDEIIQGSILSVLAGAHFVKTSTGFGFGGAKPEDVSLMKQIVGNRASVKASGGVRSKQDALHMISLGASRIGTSSGVQIVTEAPIDKGDPPKY